MDPLTPTNATRTTRADSCASSVTSTTQVESFASSTTGPTPADSLASSITVASTVISTPESTRAADTNAMKDLALERLNAILSGATVESPDRTYADNEQPTTLKELVETSLPDLRDAATYYGPPIGFAARSIVHIDHNTGKKTSVLHGTIAAPRPMDAVNCALSNCYTCRGTVATPTKPTEIATLAVSATRLRLKEQSAPPGA